MSLPRWLLRVFPRLAPQGTWADAVPVRDIQRLARFHVIYAEQVAWCRAHNIQVQAPECRVTLRTWPPEYRPPDGFYIAKVLAPNVLDPHGTLLIKDSYKDNRDILAHECRHAITGESGHPGWLFPPK